MSLARRLITAHRNALLLALWGARTGLNVVETRSFTLPDTSVLRLYRRG